MRHIISQRFTRRHDGLVQVSMTDATGEMIAITMSLVTLRDAIVAATDLVNADIGGTLDEERGQAVHHVN